MYGLHGVIILVDGVINDWMVMIGQWLYQQSLTKLMYSEIRDLHGGIALHCNRLQ